MGPTGREGLKTRWGTVVPEGEARIFARLALSSATDGCRGRHGRSATARDAGTARRVLQGGVALHASIRTTAGDMDLHLFDTKGAVERTPLPASMPTARATA